MTNLNMKHFWLSLSILVAVGTTNAGQLSPTIYYIKTIQLDQECKVKKTILSVEGKKLFSVCKDSYKSCVIEGTCAIIKEGPESTEQAVKEEDAL